MKISLDWLGDFITFTEKDPLVIADRITKGVAEVDAVEVQGALLQNCCVGEVLNVSKHPNADKLSLCEVQTDRGVKRVVCGGTNLRPGMRVAFAHTGARVRWHGQEMMTLEKTKIRGEESEGMICAAEELDLAAHFPEATGHSIIDLGDGHADVGKSLREFFGLMDTVLHIDNHAITHRPDLFSHIGFARECVALGIALWKKRKEWKEWKHPSFPKTPLPFAMRIASAKLIPRYCACLLEIKGLGETPEWMKKRLEATGWRSLNLPIDITNYVTMELGMPLHSFDADDIRGDVEARTAKAGEKITTLDSVERELPEGAIVLSDDDGIFDLLGVMGGLRSSTKDTTRKIYLHSAAVDPIAIRKAVLATGHRTDAATVYEKGVPNVTVAAGFFRALELFLELVPGAAIASKLDERGDDGTTKAIDLPEEYVTSMLGTEISEKRIEEILTDLEFTLSTPKTKNQKLKTKNSWTVTPPLFRRDISGPHDLVEEIGRIHGYNDIEPAMPLADITPPPYDARLHRLRDTLKECGYLEIVPLSLLGPNLLKKCAMDPAGARKIANPLGEELSLFMPSTLPGLLEHAESNLLLSSSDLQTFHAAHVWRRGEGETMELTLFVAEKEERLLKESAILRVKQHATELLASLGLALDVEQTTADDAGHPGRSAKLKVDEKTIGLLYEVHPNVCERFGLRHRTAAATINLTTLFALAPKTSIAKPLPQFPAITRDYTFDMDASRSLNTVLDTLRQFHKLVESVEVIDIFSGRPLSDDVYKLTVRLTMRATDRTLTEGEVDGILAGILSKLTPHVRAAQDLAKSKGA